ncbi:MAG: glycosyl transferase family 1, partial [Armatimonadota bacterium]
MDKPTVLIFTGGYLPGFKGGGPIRSIAGLVSHLSDEFCFTIITADRDLGDAAPYDGVPTDRWVGVAEAEVRYLPPDRTSLSALVSLLRETPHEALYLNSLFSPAFTLRPLLLRRLGLVPRRPVILAPRGELGAGALAAKGLKKRLFLTLAKLGGLYRHVLWQASSGYEQAEIVRCFPLAQVVVARNLASPSSSAPTERHKQAGALSLVYLARIVEK